MNMKWVGRSVRKARRWCKRHDMFLDGVCFILFFFEIMFVGTIIGAMIGG